jgi:hypothetical protein
MGRRFLVLMLAVVLAGSTVGADSCGTGGSGDGSSAPQTKPHQKKRPHKKRHHKKRHRATPQPKAIVPAPQPEPEPRTQTEPPPQPEPQPSCDPSYKGACLDPNASDYDCEGGSGDGPEYTGTVTVVGSDHYDLDRDGDGIACEP